MPGQNRGKMQYQNLINKFEKAGLHLEIVDAPLRRGRGMDQIFQMDIDRKRAGTRRYEKFRLYPGHRDNLIQVRDIDKQHSQLLLMVHEPQREFDETVQVSKWMTRERIVEGIQQQRPKPKYVDHGDYFVITNKTPAEVRYMLLGVDERQLFVAQLADHATTVEQARASLGSSVRFAEGARRGSSMDRQGEFFFLETAADTRQCIDAAIRRTEIAIKHGANIGQFAGRPQGNPHVADELVTMPVHFELNPQLRAKVYVRGKIRHVDHKTARFSNWREVIKNHEGATGTGTASGVFWID